MKILLEFIKLEFLLPGYFGDCLIKVVYMQFKRIE